MDCVACHLRLGRLSLQHPAQMEVVGYCYDDYHHNDHNDDNDDDYDDHHDGVDSVTNTSSGAK